MFRKTAKAWEEKIAHGLRMAEILDAELSEFGPAEGIVAGTQIATQMGWRPVEAIAAGDMVMTFDHGLLPVAAVKRSQLWISGRACPSQLKPLAVPVGALGNKTPMLLLPEQPVLVESDMAEALFGDPFALIPAAALEGYRGIDRITPHQRVEVVVLEFEHDQVIYANGAGMVHCASVHAGGIANLFDEEMPSYETLPLEMARSIVAGLIDEDQTAHAYACAAE
ncbi:MAG: Hint domain-containing protein [Thioclava marina]|uniref:Hint domain-containing protein n=1 Tax=Thioclava marina TaxID=1915077 RepID=UPI0019828151|nr:Hint domain-containing protein [Thioclava marina]MBC7146636.1 Hint domain-containing protein [Thioclava marina]